MSSKTYFKFVELYGGWLSVSFLPAVFIVKGAADLALPWFMASWTSLPEEGRSDIMTFVSYYTLISLAKMMSEVIKTGMVNRKNLAFNKRFEYLLNFRIIHSSIINFLDRVPSSRIITCFNSVGGSVTTELPWIIVHLLWLV